MNKLRNKVFNIIFIILTISVLSFIFLFNIQKYIELKSNVKNSYKLKYGKNKIKITVTAENGDKRKYIINVYRKKRLFG